MKRICATIAVLGVLATMVFFFGTGTASAQTVSASKTNVVPLCSGYHNDSQSTVNGVTLILWRNNCTQARHCEAKDVSYHGNFALVIIGYWSGQNPRETPPAYELPFSPGEILNTNGTLPSGAYEYVCYGYIP